MAPAEAIEVKQRAAAATRLGPGLVVALALLACTASCDGCGDDGAPRRLKNITIAPLVATVTVAGTVTFAATLNYDGPHPAVLPPVEWSVSDPGLARIDAQGNATGLAPGTVAVTARAADHSGLAQLVITATQPPRTLAALTMQPASASLVVGQTARLGATGLFSDGTQETLTARVIWSSVDPAIAAVAQDGAVTGLAAGTTEVRASLDGRQASATIQVSDPVLVSLAITPPTLALPQGASQRLTATATYSDGSRRDVTGAVTWTSSQPDIAGVTSGAGAGGQVTAQIIGQTVISATFAGQTASLPLMVVAALLDLAVDPPVASLAPGTTMVLSARGLFSDGTVRDLDSEVNWESSDAQVITVDAAGRARAVAAGTATVTARSGSTTRSSTLNVTTAALISLGFQTGQLQLAAETTRPLVLVGLFEGGVTQDLTESAQWTSDAPAVASVSTAAGSRGQVRGVAPGRTTVAASFGGKVIRCSVIVTGANLLTVSILPSGTQLARGTTAPLRALGAFSDGTTQDMTDQVTWASSSPAIASIATSRKPGLLTGLTSGQTMVSARTGTLADTVAVTVTGASLRELAVDPSSLRLARGTSLALRALGTFSDGSNQDLTGAVFWRSADPALARLSNAPLAQGLVVGVLPGTTDVTVRLMGVSGSARLEVTSATLASIAVTPAGPVIARGADRQFQAVGTFSDGSTQPLDRDVSWTSSDQGRLVVSNVPGSPGLATATAEGNATVTATLGITSGSTAVTIAPAEIARLSITPGDVTVAVGSSVDLHATAQYTDGTSQDITSQAIWESGATGVAEVSNEPGTAGRVTGKLTGSVTITIMFSGQLGFGTVRITP